VLHSLADGPGRESDLRSVLADFPGDVGAVVDELVGRGWVQRGTGEGVALTAEGRTAHEQLAAAVGRVRRTVADGLSAQEYETAVLVLARMVDNVERALREDPGR
jgi:DNA-binding MarR family transcriptional regulator